MRSDMDAFSFSLPVRAHFGAGTAEKALGSEAPALGGKVILAYGGGSVKENGIYDMVMHVLEENGIEAVDFPRIMPNPTYRKVQEGAALVREEEPSFILAVGGGSVIDCCKAVSAQAMADGDLWSAQYVSGTRPSAGVPVGAVVTASGTGAEMNDGAVITHEDMRWKGPLFGTLPSFAVLDPELTSTVPLMQVLSGAFDTLSHAMETYMGVSGRDCPSDELALAVMRCTVVNMRRLLEDADDMEARGNLMWDSAMAENGILKAGRRTDFQAHQIEHQLGALTDCNHGQGLAVILPAYYRRIAGHADEKLGRIGKHVFGVEGADGAVRALADFVSECGLPTRLSGLRSDTRITPELLREVADSANIISTNPKKLSRDDVYSILLDCL